MTRGELLTLLIGGALVILLMMPLFIFNEVSFEFVQTLAWHAAQLVMLTTLIVIALWSPLILLWIFKHWTMPRIREVVKLLRKERGA